MATTSNTAQKVSTVMKLIQTLTDSPKKKVILTARKQTIVLTVPFLFFTGGSRSCSRSFNLRNEVWEKNEL